jgi:predicted ATPase/DNA-binding SARP family transcriptional activator
MPQKNFVNGSQQIRIYLLGHFRVECEAESIQLPTRKTESLLAYLVLNPESHAREKLAALFWGDSSDTKAQNSLRNALAVLNKKLGHELFIVDRQTVQINMAYPLWVDALRFESQVLSFLADPVSDPTMVNLALYQNDLLTDFYDDWVFPKRDHYQSLFIETLLQLTQRMRSLSEYKKAIEYARKVLTFDKTNEHAHQHLMFCFMALGDRSSALRQYEDCKRVLEEYLAVEPSTPTVALYEWIKQSPPEAKPFEARITNLPIPITSFIGRKREMTEIKLLLSSSRLFTLVGPGGSGKTRLAIQIGIDLLDFFRDGVWWVDLSAITDDTLVTQLIAKSFGVQDAADQPLVETLTSHLRSKFLLLIIDNCEQLINACAQIVDLLLKECPHLKIMTTSRESLNISGEHVHDIPPMVLPDPQKLSLLDLLVEYDGIRLFVERARSVDSNFALTDENASFVAQICFDLDGMPLAIELAAARIKVLTPEQIAVRLNDRFQLLISGSRTALPRHQTLQAVMDWSYNLLSEKERSMFQRLAVFSGGWSLDAVEAVYSNEHKNTNEVINLLSNLVDKSLVIKDGEQAGTVRYRMLETIRKYAYVLLQRSGHEREVQEQHLAYFSRLAKAPNPHLGFFLPDEEMISWMKILLPELGNLRSAMNFCRVNPDLAASGLEMAARLHWFWLVSNQLSEGRDWIDKLLMVSKIFSGTLQAQALLSKGFISCWLGDFTSARPSLEKSLKLFEDMGDDSGVAFSLHGLGFTANGLGEPAEAGLLLEECLNLARKIEDGWLVSFALHFIAIGTSFRGDYELARSQFEEHIKLTEKGTGNAQGVAFSLFHLGRIARLQRDYVSAYAHHSEGMQLFWQLGDKRGLGYSLFGFACLAQAKEEPYRAALLFGVVDSIREDLGSLLEVILQDEFEQAKSATLDAIGADDFNSAWSKGYDMGLEQAFQYALSKD